MNNETVNRILAAVAIEYGFGVEHLVGKNRTGAVAQARQLCCVAIRETTALSFPEIGVALGNRHHSSIMTAVKVGRRIVERDPRLRLVLDRAIEAGDSAKLQELSRDRLRRQYQRLAAVNEEIRRLQARKADLERAIKVDEEENGVLFEARQEMRAEGSVAAE